MFDGEQEGDGGIVTRRRGRHAAPAGAAASAGGLRGRLLAASAPLLARVEPRATAVGAWLFERRLHVLIVAASVATVAMIGGAMALISFVGFPAPGGGAANLVDSPRPTSTDSRTPSPFAPILPTPGPTPSAEPGSPTPPPEGEPNGPVGDAPPDPTADPTEPDEPTEEPAPEEPNGRPDPPGHSNKPDKPKP